MNRIKTFIAISAFSLLVLALPAVASAQWRNDPYGNNGRYGNGNLRSAVQNLKDRARDFERMTNNNGRYNRGGGDSIENLADQFKRAADRLESRFGNGRNLDNSYDEAQRVLSIASQIDNQLSYNSRGNNRRGGWGNTGYGGYGGYGGNGGSNIQGAWNSMRYDLQTIANAYGNNGGYRNNRSRIGNLPWPF